MTEKKNGKSANNSNAAENENLNNAENDNFLGGSVDQETGEVTDIAAKVAGPAELIAALKESKKVATSDMKSLTSNYLNFDDARAEQKTDEFNLVFAGFGTIKDQTSGNEKRCARLFNEAGEELNNADIVMLNSMDKWQAKNPGVDAVVIRVIYTGEKIKTENGTYRKLNIVHF